MPRLFESDVGEQRLPLSRLETDDELEKLHGAARGDEDKISACKQRLRELSWS